jgi:TetR/AcrR family transcriptional repressor of nem operon
LISPSAWFRPVASTDLSYADIAGELGITKVALHYHVPGEAELGEALIARHAARFAAARAGIDASGTSASERLAGYAGIYLGVLKDEPMCLCGMLAAEYQTLPDPMRCAVGGFL